MKKAIRPAGATKPAPKGSVTKQSSPKPKATGKPSTSTFMKKASKPGSAPKPAPTQPATNPSAAKPKAMAKSSMKPKPRVAEGQAELIQVVARLAMSAEKLAQAADRLTEAAVRASQAGDRHNQTPKIPDLPRDEAVDLATSQQREMVDAPGLTVPEGTDDTDSKALEENPGIPEPPEDE
jgi:hypothetical protein